MAGSDLCSSHLRIAHRKTNLTPQLADQLALLLRSVTRGGVCGMSAARRSAD
jgi:hypothetical protein